VMQICLILRVVLILGSLVITEVQISASFCQSDEGSLKELPLELKSNFVG